MAINIKPPSASEFAIGFEQSGADKYFTGNFTYDDLLLAHGNHMKDYTDLTQVAKGFYSQYSLTLSEERNPFYEFLAGVGIQDIKDNFVRWRIYSKPDRRAISMGNPNTLAECYGAGGFSFKIRLDVDWYGPSDLLAPIRNKRCIVLVESESKNVGGAYEYDVIMLTRPENAEVFPSEYFKDGDYWIKMGAVASDLGSNEYSSIQFGWDWAYIEFEVPMHTMQYKISVEEEAHEKWGNIELARCLPDGEPMPGTGKLSNFLEMEAMAQIEKEKEMYLIYGQMTDHLVDETTGRRKTTAPGLMQFLEEGNTIPYHPSANGLDRMMNEIDGIWYDRIPIAQRRLLLYTGQGGYKLFNEWVRQKFNTEPVTIPYDFVLGSSTSADTGKTAYQYNPPQFTSYKLDFGEVTIAMWPLLDDTRLNGVLMPHTQYPVSSYEFIAFDIGFGEPNVQLLRRSSKDFMSFIPGMWSPFGRVGQDNPVFKVPVDTSFWGYHWIYRASFGLLVMDTSRLLRFIPSVKG
jgi:hypothetical protein